MRSSVSCAGTDQCEWQIALRPLPLACRFATTSLIALAATALAACLKGDWMLALAWVMVATPMAAGLRRDIWLQGRNAPVALAVCADGQLLLLRRQGSFHPVSLASGSLFLGSGAILVLSGPQTCRLLLGPGNVTPDRLAALRRLLRGLRT